MDTSLRHQAIEEARASSLRNTSLVLSSHELMALFQIRETLKEELQHHSPANLSQLYEYIVDAGYPYVTGKELSFRNSHYADSAISQPLLKPFGLTVEPKRRTLSVKQIFALPHQQLVKLLELAQEWHQSHDQEIAQFTASLKISEHTHTCLLEIHYRHSDKGSNHFSSLGRAFRLLLRDCSGEIQHQIRHAEDQKEENRALVDTISRLFRHPPIHSIRDRKLFGLLEDIRKLTSEESEDLLGNLVRAMHFHTIDDSSRLDNNRKAIIWLANRCIMQSHGILTTSSIINHKLDELERENKTGNPTCNQKILGQLYLCIKQFTDLIPEQWIQQHLAKLNPVEIDEIHRRANMKSTYLDRFIEHCQ